MREFTAATTGSRSRLTPPNDTERCGTVRVGFVDPALPLFEPRSAPQDRVAQPLASHEHELAAPVAHLAGERHVQRARVLGAVDLVRQVLLEAVHASPLGRDRYEPLGSLARRKHVGRLTDLARRFHRHERPLELGVVVQGADESLGDERAAAERLALACTK